MRLMFQSPKVSRDTSCDLAHIQRRDLIIAKPELGQDAACMCAELRRANRQEQFAALCRIIGRPERAKVGWRIAPS